MQNTLCYFFSFFIEAVILSQYAANLFTPKHSQKTNYIILCTLYLCLFAVSLLGLKWLNMGLYLFFNFVFLFSQYHTKWYTALFHSAILASLMGMCELMVYSVIERFTPHFFAQVEYFHNTILFAIFSKTIFFTTIYLLIHFFQGWRKCCHTSDISIFLFTFVPISSVFVMLTFVSISDIYTLSPSHNRMIATSAFLLLAANLLVFGMNQYHQKKNAIFTEMQLSLQKEADLAEYYQMLLSQNENQTILIHDIKKHLHSIAMLNENKEYNKIDSYIHQLISSSALQGISRLCENDMLNAILSRYKNQCAKQNISFLTDIRSGTTSFISDSDLTALFCNLLENAMEASYNLPNAFIEVTVNQKENIPITIITVINSSRKIVFPKQSHYLPTTKSDKQKHGFGIKSIQKIVDHYHGNFQMYYDDNNATFHTIITLKSSIL